MSLITQYKEAELADDMAGERRSNAWAALVEVSKQFSKMDNFIGALKVEEDSYMEDMYGDVPEAKKSNGDWKYRKFKFVADGEDQVGGLPMAYMSAKSTIKQARENAIKIMEAGEPLAKDKLTKALAAKKDTTTPYQKALNHIKRLEVVFPDLTADEQAAVRTKVSHI